ncbi:hypothetical protein [Natronococcus pandeyae]|nr:hypothetical protein [Natronococcus pandeyae]
MRPVAFGAEIVRTLGRRTREEAAVRTNAIENRVDRSTAPI